MAKTKAQKKEILDNLKEKLKNAKSVVFAEYDALGVKENEELRNKLREENSEYVVAKKTLIDLAIKDNKIEGVNVRDFEGKVATIFGYEDEVAPAKVADEFRKDREDKIKFIAGILENKLLSGKEIEALAKLPSKQELYAKIVGSINAPVSRFVNVMAGNLRGLMNVLKAIEEKKS